MNKKNHPSDEHPGSLEKLLPKEVPQIVKDILQGTVKNRVVGAALAFETALIIIGLPVLLEEKFLFLLSLTPYPLTFHPAYVTGKAYREAKEFISRTGGLRGYMFLATRKHRKKGRYAEYFLGGYCELQGIYLAAKEAGLEKEFYELKEEFTHNILPNF